MSPRRSRRLAREPFARRTAANRPGFTLPELMVAVVLMSVGVLALAGGSAGVLRQMRAGNQSSQATFVAQSRLETLRSLGCNSMSSGTATTRGMSEAWQVGSITGKVATVAETVSYVPRAGATRKFGLKVYVPCK